MIESYIPSLSTYSGDIDFVFDLIFYICAFWFFLAEGVLFWFIYRYRKKPDDDRPSMYMDGTDPKHTAWISRPHALILACDVVIIVFAVKIWYQVKQDMPPADETVRVIAQQWAWTFQHAGGDGKLDTGDDIRTVDDMHIVAGKTYHYELIAKDVLHSFSVPVFRLKQDAIPGRVIKGWFKATKPGVFDIQCAEMCGIGHGVMGARVIIESPDQHATWLVANGSAPTAAPAAPAPAAPAAPAAPTPAPDGAAPDGAAPEGAAPEGAAPPSDTGAAAPAPQGGATPPAPAPAPAPAPGGTP